MLLDRKHLRCKSYRFSLSGKISPIKMSWDVLSFCGNFTTLQDLHLSTHILKQYNYRIPLPRTTSTPPKQQRVAQHNRVIDTFSHSSFGRNGITFRPKCNCQPAETDMRFRRNTLPRTHSEDMQSTKNALKAQLDFSCPYIKVWYEQYTFYNIWFITSVLSAS